MKRLCGRIIVLGVFVLSACNLPSLAPKDEAQSTPSLTSPGGAAPLVLTGVQSQLGDTLPWVDGGLLVYIPAGEFIMGENARDNPEHTVNLGAFWIYRTEVTNRMYARCVSMGKCSSPAVDPSLPDFTDPELADAPIVGVVWEQAEAYCQFVGGHLPSEAQWEKTARGPDGNLYPWGHEEPTCDLLNFNDCIGGSSDVLDYPEGRSFYEVFDMAGNVFEWVADWYQEAYYIESPLQDPPGPESGEFRSVRGSTFASGPDQIPSTLRYYQPPEEYRADLGFRCVLANPFQYAPLCQVLAYVPANPPGGAGSVTPETTGCIVRVPELEIVNWCQGGKRHVNINYSIPHPPAFVTWSGTAGCDFYDADTLGCVGSGDQTIWVKVCHSCEPTPGLSVDSPSCDPPYVLDVDAGLCVFTSDALPGTECTPGFIFDPELLCCELESGEPASYPACPTGSTYDNYFSACVSESLPGEIIEGCEEQTIYFDACRNPNEGCRRTATSCQPNGFDAVRCCCTNQNNACLP